MPITSTINTGPEMSHSNWYTTHFKSSFYSFIWTVWVSAPWKTLSTASLLQSVMWKQFHLLQPHYITNLCLSYLVSIFACWDEKNLLNCLKLWEYHMNCNCEWCYCDFNFLCSARRTVTIDCEPSNHMEEPHLYPHFHHYSWYPELITALEVGNEDP